MKRILTITSLAFLLSACGAPGGNNNGTNPDSANKAGSAETKPDAPAAIKAGDTVVARWSSDSFYEGKVESIDGSRARIAWSDNSSPSQVDMADVYALPKAGAKPDVKVGDVVLGKRSTGTYWNGAEITSITDGVYVVKYTNDNNTGNLPPEKIVAISAATAADFKSQAGKNDFLTKAQAGSPVRPAGYKPKVGDRVLGEWTSKSWYPAKVTAIAGGKATLAWEDNSKPTELAFDKFFAFPTAANSSPASTGDYLIVKPASGNGKWDYAQVTSATGGAVEAKMADGSTRSLKPGDYVVVK